MNRQNSTLKKAMLKALEKSLNIVTTACKEVGIDRQTHYNWKENDPEYKAAVEDLDEMVLDFAESKLHKQINENNPTSTIFFLKTKGKKRGYIERHEVTGPDNEPLQVKVIFEGTDAKNTGQTPTVIS